MNVSSPSSKDCPKVLTGFEHITRSFDPSQGKCTARILPGEYYVTPSDEMITTVLGSCVSACIRDPRIGVGGMNHFMLPGDDGKNLGEWGGTACMVTRFGVAAMESLINEILKAGGLKERLEVKLFGGGHVLAMDMNKIGQRNIDFVKEFVQAEKLHVLAEDLGGPHPRKINFFPKDGRVMVRKLRSLHANTVADQEKRYQKKLVSEPETAGSIELFD